MAKSGSTTKAVGPEAEKPRRECRPIEVWCSLDERAKIAAGAAEANMSLSSYLRALGLGHRPDSKLDYKAVLDMQKEGADLRRYGGLLKMWLSDDARLKAHGKERVHRYIELLMQRTTAITERMQAHAQAIIPLKGDRRDD